MYRLRAKVAIELPEPQPAVLAVLGDGAAAPARPPWGARLGPDRG